MSSRPFFRVLALTIVATANSAFAAAIIFDNFNVDEGHFGYAPNFSGQTRGLDPSSTADRVETDGPLEGVAHAKLVLVPNNDGNEMRVRFLSGGPPYTGANAATPAGNAGFEFQTGPGIDGFIGFYLRALPSAEGWEVSINLDGAGGVIGEMDGSLPVPVIADGQYHLYEWDLDLDGSWGTIPGIGGSSRSLPGDGIHTVDSLYFREVDGAQGPTAEFFVDFVAKSDQGSIALLVPEPSSFALFLLGAAGLTSRMRRCVN